MALAVAATAAAAPTSPPVPRAIEAAPNAPFAPGEAIVRFRPGTTADERRSTRAAARTDFERTLRIPRTQLVEVDGSVSASVRRLEREPNVAYAQPNYRYDSLAVPDGWTTSVFNGGVPWGLSTTAMNGDHSAADSPAGSYGNAVDSGAWGGWAESRLVTTSPVDLTSERGCRMHFNLSHDIEAATDVKPGDLLEAGAATSPTDWQTVVASYHTGSTGGSFFREEVSIAPHDGEPAVHPWFALLSDASTTRDGAYIDDLRLICRDETYVDAISPGALYDQPDVGNYVRFQGTSMAAPHVAGIAALVRAAVPGASNTDMIDAIKQGGAPLESLDGKTVTGCTADAAGAIAVARGDETGPCSASDPPASPSPPNDTFFGDLWGLSDPAGPDPGVNALKAWEETQGAGQVIAIVDTGVDLTHPDLEGNLWTDPVGGNHGFDFVDGDSDPDDYDFHGTHVAGTVAATGDNGLGIVGVAPHAEVMAVRVLDGNGSGSSSDIGDGIAYAAANDADVINLSLGGSGATDTHMSTAIAAADAAGAVVVAAAGNSLNGNDNDVNPTVPCSLPEPNIICVAAVTQSGGLAGFSHYGDSSVDLGAPGTNILSAKTDYGSPLLTEGFESATTDPPTDDPPTDDPPPSTETPDDPPPPSATETSSDDPPPVDSPSDPMAGPSVSLRDAKGRIRVSRRGVLRYVLRATPNTTGRIVLRTRRKVRVARSSPARRRHVMVARKRFSVRATGKAVVRIKLSRRALRILRLNRRARLRVAVKVRDASGQTATARRRLLLLAPRARRR